MIGINIHFDDAELNNLYLMYKTDPANVTKDYQIFFAAFELGLNKSQSISNKFSGIGYIERYLLKYFQENGHLFANINPLITPTKIDISSIVKNNLLIDFNHNESLFNDLESTSLSDEIKNISDKYARIYCNTVGVEFSHISSEEERNWLFQEYLNSQNYQLPSNLQLNLFQELFTADALEKFLHTKYLGKKRFSLEGSESIICALNTAINTAKSLGAEEISMSMAHRGRLSTLVNVVKMPLEQLFLMFEDTNINSCHAGDVKYHCGYESVIQTRDGNPIKVSLSYNPSHLEAVDGVLLGETRALIASLSNNTSLNSNIVLPIMVHGDAALSGQGIVYETLSMMKLDGYTVGGTLHLVINNQIGFTTDPKDSRSTNSPTDIAKAFDIPVIHVNGNDVEAVHKMLDLAVKYRYKFHKDIFIDVISYRTHGHNEGDEPLFTQPVLYKKIKNLKPQWQLYRDNLTGQIKNDIAITSIIDTEKNKMQLAYSDCQQEIKKNLPCLKCTGEICNFNFGTENQLLDEVNTKVPREKLKLLATKFLTIPPDFTLNPKLEKGLFKDRLEMANSVKDVDWGMAEMLAYASLLSEGYSIRISGQDVKRGTFSHRHASIFDINTGIEYCLLNGVITNNSKVEVINSSLSEYGVLGFEYGYARKHNQTLVIWEAQFGDFANTAQVIIDQFIAAAETKWCLSQNLVLFLPHGMEGQGPEHSSARIERFLDLAAKGNMQICNVTNSSQLFHVLRRQVHRKFKKPLVLFTPKSLLRSSSTAIELKSIAESTFQNIIVEPEFIQNKSKNQIQKVLFTSGKLGVELLEYKTQYAIKNVAIVKIEQLYPLDTKAINILIQSFSPDTQLFWAQEEPKNMGSWDYISHLIPNLQYIGRKESSSPASGSEKKHKLEQQEIIRQAFAI